MESFEEVYQKYLKEVYCFLLRLSGDREIASYTLNMTHADGTAGTIYLSSTDKYLTGEKNAPENVTVLGGKTGTTDEAGSCLALVSQNAYGEPFISVILHASTKVELYEDMNTLLSNINS